jgi:GNAT superfamily N-acetyltransferase
MLVIRNATAVDTPLITGMIREFAEFEHELEQVDITPEDLLRDGFRANPLFHALLAEWDGQTAAYALYFFTYSTVAGRASLFVEDLFVRAQFRRKGIGKSAPAPHGGYRARAELLRHALGGAQREHSRNQFLSFAWRQNTE